MLTWIIWPEPQGTAKVVKTKNSHLNRQVHYTTQALSTIAGARTGKKSGMRLQQKKYGLLIKKKKKMPMLTKNASCCSEINLCGSHAANYSF